MRINSNAIGSFDLTPLLSVNLWSITFFIWDACNMRFEQKKRVMKRDELISTLFDIAIGCKSIDYMDYDGRSSNLAIVLIDDKTMNTNITPMLIENMSKLRLFWD